MRASAVSTAVTAGRTQLDAVCAVACECFKFRSTGPGALAVVRCPAESHMRGPERWPYRPVYAVLCSTCLIRSHSFGPAVGVPDIDCILEGRQMAFVTISTSAVLSIPAAFGAVVLQSQIHSNCLCIHFKIQVQVELKDYLLSVNVDHSDCTSTPFL